MDDRAWVGSPSRCPAGWTVCDSVDTLLTIAGTPSRILVDDQAGGMRDAAFSRLYGHFPLTKIERVVGPWRAGVGRTDPQWPMATTRREECLPDGNTWNEAVWAPLTSGYDDLAQEEAVPSLAGLRFGIQIADRELREMWSDWLTYSGGELSGLEPADVLIRDISREWPKIELSAVRGIITLRPDPWNAVNTLDTDQHQSGQATVLAVSLLDSPARIMQRVLSLLPRATL